VKLHYHPYLVVSYHITQHTVSFITEVDRTELSAQWNKGQSNLAEGDIALLSYSLGGSKHHEVGPGGYIWDPILGKGGRS